MINVLHVFTSETERIRVVMAEATTPEEYKVIIDSESQLIMEKITAILLANPKIDRFVFLQRLMNTMLEVHKKDYDDKPTK